jgi:hypothetical protein
MTYACFAWEIAADNHLLKLQRLQNKVLRTIGNFPRRTPVRDLHMAFKILTELWLSQLRVAIVRSEKLIDEVGDRSGTRMETKIRR